MGLSESKIVPQLDKLYTEVGDILEEFSKIQSELLYCHEARILAKYKDFLSHIDTTRSSLQTSLLALAQALEEAKKSRPLG